MPRDRMLELPPARLAEVLGEDLKRIEEQARRAVEGGGAWQCWRRVAALVRSEHGRQLALAAIRADRLSREAREAVVLAEAAEVHDG